MTRASGRIRGCIEGGADLILISCPHCGPRDEAEFVYGGPRRVLPAMGQKTDTEDWLNAVHYVLSPQTPLTELWYHESGCETWIEVTRDTRTHEITDCGLPDRKGGGS